jgi:hypothetical protein
LSQRIRLLPKKRGHRRSDSRQFGNVGEVVFFTALLLIGSFVLVALITTRYVDIPGLPILRTGDGLWLAIIVLSSLISIGIGGLVWTLLNVTVSAERRSALAQKAAELTPDTTEFQKLREYPTLPKLDNLTNSPGTYLKHRLPQLRKPAFGLLSLMLFSLMWIVLLAVFVVVVTKSFLTGSPAWLLLVMTFLLAAVATRFTQGFLKAAQQMVREGNTSVEVSELPLYPGQRYDVSLVQSGRIPLSSVVMMLVCEENATYREGTNVRFETQRVVEWVVIEENEISPSADGDYIQKAELLVPEKAMHSFRAASNNIQWKLVVQGSVIKNRQFEREFPVVVYPALHSAEQP